MAYISHSPFDYRSFRQRAGRLSPSILIRSAIVAVAVATVILALSDGFSTSSTSQAGAGKSDRLGAVVSSPGEIGRLTVDAASRTTTVERGEAAALDPASPMAAETK